MATFGTITSTAPHNPNKSFEVFCLYFYSFPRIRSVTVALCVLVESRKWGVCTREKLLTAMKSRSARLQRVCASRLKFSPAHHYQSRKCSDSVGVSSFRSYSHLQMVSPVLLSALKQIISWRHRGIIRYFFPLITRSNLCSTSS